MIGEIIFLGKISNIYLPLWVTWHEKDHLFRTGLARMCKFNG
jgi:hypothetical protein